MRREQLLLAQLMMATLAQTLRQLFPVHELDMSSHRDDG